MGKRKKRRHLGPRRKRMQRPARLQAAVKWRSGTEARTSSAGTRVGLASIAARNEARTRLRAANLAKKSRAAAIEWPDDWPAEWILGDDDGNGIVAIEETPY